MTYGTRTLPPARVPVLRAPDRGEPCPTATATGERHVTLPPLRPATGAGSRRHTRRHRQRQLGTRPVDAGPGTRDPARPAGRPRHPASAAPLRRRPADRSVRVPADSRGLARGLAGGRGGRGIRSSRRRIRGRPRPSPAPSPPTTSRGTRTTPGGAGGCWPTIWRPPAGDPALLGWDGIGRQRAEFALPGAVRPDGDDRVLVDVRVRVTPYRAVGDRTADEPGPDPDVPGVPAAAPAPTGRGWQRLRLVLGPADRARGAGGRPAGGRRRRRDPGRHRRRHRRPTTIRRCRPSLDAPAAGASRGVGAGPPRSRARTGRWPGEGHASPGRGGRRRRGRHHHRGRRPARPRRAVGSPARDAPTSWSAAARSTRCGGPRPSSTRPVPEPSRCWPSRWPGECPAARCGRAWSCSKPDAAALVLLPHVRRWGTLADPLAEAAQLLVEPAARLPRPLRAYAAALRELVAAVAASGRLARDPIADPDPPYSDDRHTRRTGSAERPVRQERSRPQVVGAFRPVRSDAQGAGRPAGAVQRYRGTGAGRAAPRAGRRSTRDEPAPTLGTPPPAPVLRSADEASGSCARRGAAHRPATAA